MKIASSVTDKDLALFLLATWRDELGKLVAVLFEHGVCDVSMGGGGGREAGNEYVLCNVYYIHKYNGQIFLLAD